MTGPRPAALLPAAVLIALEGVSALAYGVVEAFQTRSDRLVVGVGAAVLLVGYGIGLLVHSNAAFLSAVTTASGPVEPFALMDSKRA